MRITKLEAILLRPRGTIDIAIADGSQDGLLVRVHTDDGIIGLGEVDSSPAIAKAIIEAPSSHKLCNGLAALLIGENPLEIGRLWQKMYKGSLYYGRRGAAIHAISGVEIALWDIAGKAAGKPIHALLGGARRDKVKAYASTLMPDKPKDAARAVETQMKAGFKAVKLGWGPLGQSAELDVALVAAARKAGGDDLDLMIDVGKGWQSARDGIDRARRMEEYNPFWIEEPFWPDDYAKYAALAAAVSTPIAGGEEETTLADFERLVEKGNVEILQPDVTRAGGISECLRVADYARRQGKRCVLHAWSTGIIKAATLQVLAAMEEAEYMEYCVQTTDLNQRLVAERFPLKDGFVAIPNGPGLGIELDEKALKEFAVR
ncbi:MAG TPA: mandelate racemase/muconate lactonizing enzyme family protein [Dongiaceae bacterium]